MYNGWRNQNTWLVALWVDNSEFWQSEVDEQCKHLVNDFYETEFFTEGDIIDQLAKFIEELIESSVPDFTSTASLYTDLLNHALADVYYDEIASNWIEDEIKSRQS